MYIIHSSAKSLIFESMFLQISFTHTRNSSGHKTPPYGTPEITLTSLNGWPPTLDILCTTYKEFPYLQGIPWTYTKLPEPTRNSFAYKEFPYLQGILWPYKEFPYLQGIPLSARNFFTYKEFPYLQGIPLPTRNSLTYKEFPDPTRNFLTYKEFPYLQGIPLPTRNSLTYKEFPYLQGTPWIYNEFHCIHVYCTVQTRKRW
jgi:hypothetical protein